MSILQNKIFISTRPKSETDSIKIELQNRGAIVVDFPMIEIIPINLSINDLQVLKNVHNFQWLIFTSKNGVKCFFKNLNINSLGKIKIAVIGKSTAQEVETYHQKVDFITNGTTDEFLQTFHNQVYTSDNILLIQGKNAPDTIEKTLFAHRIDVYETLPCQNFSSDILQQIQSHTYTMILFTSPSGVKNFKSIVGNRKDFSIACIGKTTEKELLKYEIVPNYVSTHPDSITFVNGLENYFSI